MNNNSVPATGKLPQLRIVVQDVTMTGVLFGAVLLASVNQFAAADERIDYLRDIQPLLQEKCFSCHSARKQEGGLRLDAAILIRKGGEGGPAVTPRSASSSLLLERVTAAEDERMPPAESGTRLTADQIAKLSAWINQGAVAPEESIPEAPSNHWSFQPPVASAPPDITGGWIRNDMDRFLATEHQRLGVTAVGEASRSMLLRRVSLDLTGLPPTRDELQAFCDDESPFAFEHTVDRLLASPLYGERWARHFMDVWRYSDPSGYGKEIRDGRQHIWRWRDWIVESLNADKGYDQMVTEMLAADEAMPDDHDALRATGFLARNWYKFNRNVWLDNIVEHSSKAFLGLTVNCARCHAHKFDPIEQVGYYRMRAIFETHDVRDDPLPLASEELVRTYDAHLTRETFLFQQGDADRPDREHSLTPGLPEILGELAIVPVQLPVTAWYPALRADVRSAALADAVSKIAAAENALQSAQLKLNKSRQQLDEPLSEQDSQVPVEVNESAVALALAKRRTAESARASLLVRTEAELVKHGLGQGDLKELAAVAGRADRQLGVARLEEQIAQSELKLLTSRHSPPTDTKALKDLAQEQTQLAEKLTQLETAKSMLDNGSDEYPALGPIYPQTSSGRRLAFARWITNRKNPLSARALVNHVWLRHFDAPLVERIFDLGLRSGRPQHLALLDWLAVRLMQDDWSLKSLHRTMVTSGTYRLRSSATEGTASTRTRDPDNHGFWRMNARRMEAEVVRDSVLYLGGSLDLRTGGPPIDHTQGQDVPRRSLYFRQDKERQMTFLSLFDGAKVNECYQRKATVAPQQALALFNSPLGSQQAKNVADVYPSLTSNEFVHALFEHVLCREPSAQELRECTAFLSEFDENVAARRQLALVLLNHNDFVTIR